MAIYRVVQSWHQGKAVGWVVKRTAHSKISHPRPLFLTKVETQTEVDRLNALEKSGKVMHTPELKTGKICVAAKLHPAQGKEIKGPNPLPCLRL